MRNTESLQIDGAVGKLEALHDKVRNATPAHAGVVCHPHPLHEGSMHNKVAYMLARSLNQSGIPALRFNFRGVGKSAGEYDDGIGEIDDTLAALQWTQHSYPDAKLVLAGFSFGAQVSLHAAQRRDVAALISVAPPVQRFAADFKPAPGCPWLIVQGEDDELVPAAAVREWAGKLAERPTFATVVGADHFFHGKLNDLRETVRGFLDKVL